MNPTRERVAIVLFLGLAVWLRLPGLFHDLPFSYYGDELHFVKRSMALGTGDLNPHWFHKPALLMYLLLFCFGMLFLGGRVTGAWASTEEFGAHFLADQGVFLLVARLLVFAFGMGAVWFGSRIARRVAGPVGGIAAGGFLALLPAMVGASQVVKADIPSAFFVAAASWAYLRGSADRTRPLVLAGILAGASMGTKYYGIIVVPGIVLAELLEVVGRRMSVGRFVRRGVLLAAVFVATFFVTSPYNFLDPLWRETIQRKIGRMVSLPPLPPGTAHAVEAAQAAETAHAVEAASAEEVHFDPDSGVEFKPGLGAVPGALLHFGGELVDRRALGWGFLLLILLGLAPFARDGPGRRTLAVLGTPALIFTFFAVTIMAYHVNPRQLTAVFPLLGAFLWPGARLADVHRPPARHRRDVAGGRAPAGGRRRAAAAHAPRESRSDAGRLTDHRVPLDRGERAARGPGAPGRLRADRPAVARRGGPAARAAGGVSAGRGVHPARGHALRPADALPAGARPRRGTARASVVGGPGDAGRGAASFGAPPGHGESARGPDAAPRGELRGRGLRLDRDEQRGAAPLLRQRRGGGRRSPRSGASTRRSGRGSRTT